MADLRRVRAALADRPILRLIAIFTVVIAALAAAGAVSWRQIRGEIEDRAQAEAQRTVGDLADNLKQTDKLFATPARAGAADLRARSVRRGPPTLRAQKGGGAPVLKFGDKAANGDFTLVDRGGRPHGRRGDAVRGERR